MEMIVYNKNNCNKQSYNFGSSYESMKHLLKIWCVSVALFSRRIFSSPLFDRFVKKFFLINNIFRAFLFADV